MPTPPDTGPSDLYRALIAAWNARDAARMAAQFADDGNLIGFDGSQVDTRASIEAHLQPIFRDHPTASYVAIVREVRLLNAAVAVVRGIAGMIPPGQDDFKRELTTVHTLVASRDGPAPDGRWRAAVFQGTPAAWHGRRGDLTSVLDELRAERSKLGI